MEARRGCERFILLRAVRGVLVSLAHRHAPPSGPRLSSTSHSIKPPPLPCSSREDSVLTWNKLGLREPGESLV